MRPMLNLIGRLLTRGRLLFKLGCDREALHVLRRLAGFRDLPPEAAEEAHAMMAAVQLRRRKFRPARRHLAAALALRPDNARYHYLMATALDADDKADPERALRHYRKSLRLDPEQPECLSEYGLLAVYLGHTCKGLKALRRAVELAPDNPAITGKLVEALCQAEQPEDARRELRSALFRNSRDGRFGKLWSDFRFRQVQEQQAASRWQGRSEVAGDEPVFLPFLRPEPGEPLPFTNRTTIRRDGAHGPAAPHWPRPSRLPDQRHAQ